MFVDATKLFLIVTCLNENKTVLNRSTAVNQDTKTEKRGMSKMVLGMLDTDC